jgi:hypothetical protein
MKTFLELARNFYGVRIPFYKRKGYFKSVMEYLEKRYSIETAIGMALDKLHLI